MDEITGDLYLLHNLYEFHLRRERALGYVEPSDFLLSIRSVIVLVPASRFLETSLKVVEGEKLYTLVMANKKKIDRLTRRIRKSRSKKRIRTWYAIIVKLYDQLEEANEKLEKLAND